MADAGTAGGRCLALLKLLLLLLLHVLVKARHAICFFSFRQRARGF
jgi:hypothetical protein